MAGSKKKRNKPFTGYPSEKGQRTVAGQGPSSPVKQAVTIDSGQSAHAASVGSASHEAPRLRRGPGGKFLIPVAVGALGGTAYALHRRKTVTKSLFDPISGDEVVFSKGPKQAVQGVRYARHHGNGVLRRTGAAMGRNPGKTLAGAIVAGGAIDTRNNIKTYKEAKNGKPVGRARGVFYPQAARMGYKARIEAQGVGKSVSPMFGSNHAFTGPATSVRMLVPTGGHVGQANNFTRSTPLKGYRRTPSGSASQRLLHVKKSDEFVARLGLGGVDRLGTYGRQVGRHGVRIA